ncbi:MAG: 5-formyltetrahydrofolate cyclo-ligase [Prevotella sp.]|nr:5-formyltetrahydrofolate cyclo-ligase [Prevotella sp.]MBR1462940.1 5-formyltetrahydrofolate cyclo-ligase [Prevotella sp.]
MDKKDLRKFIRMQKSMFSNEKLDELSQPIIKRLLAHPRVKNAHTILMYYSLQDEVNTHDVINQLVKDGKTVLLPAVLSDTEMELRIYESAKDLVGGFFNIMEPVGKLFSQYEKIDTAVVPGMAFDSRCNRLGRGKGYYDRLLPKLPDAYKIGVCFDFQKLPGIPADENDVKMDEVL